MLAVDFYRIHPDQVARLKEWMAEITTRRNEALETYVQEGVRHEMGYLIDGREGRCSFGSWRCMTEMRPHMRSSTRSSRSTCSTSRL